MAETSKGPAVTSANLPRSPVVPQPVAQESIVARPLVLPDFSNVKPKNPNVSLRWINAVAGQGQRLDQMTAMGFVKAEPSEVYLVDPTGKHVDIPESMKRDGAIRFGDIICMKISRSAYEGAKLYNAERAAARVGRNAQAERGRDFVNQALRDAGAPPPIASKISAFVPSESELSGLVGKDDQPRNR